MCCELSLRAFQPVERLPRAEASSLPHPQGARGSRVHKGQHRGDVRGCMMVMMARMTPARMRMAAMAVGRHDDGEQEGEQPEWVRERW